MKICIILWILIQMVRNSVWTDGWIIFQYFDIYNNENLPINIKFCQSRFKMLPNAKYTLQSLPEIINLWPNIMFSTISMRHLPTYVIPQFQLFVQKMSASASKRCCVMPTLMYRRLRFNLPLTFSTYFSSTSQPTGVVVSIV